jgi:hypothetical protein
MFEDIERQVNGDDVPIKECLDLVTAYRDLAKHLTETFSSISDGAEKPLFHE